MTGGKSMGRKGILEDQGPEPYVLNIEEATLENDLFRVVVWTGKHSQVTLMSIPPEGEVGLEVHEGIDQFLRIEQGQGRVLMGSSRDNLMIQEEVADKFAIIVPSGTWHNVINTGSEPLKLYSIYSPAKHPAGTVHHTKEEADEDEED
jgi:mannose-6-phosphate isomerase-like protein (cupin superfamily)